MNIQYSHCKLKLALSSGPPPPTLYPSIRLGIRCCNIIGRYTSVFAAVSQGCCHVTVGITQHILLARDQVSEGARKLPLLRLCHRPSHYHCKGTARPSIKK